MTRRHVLLVEDDPDIRRLCRYLLEPEGYELSEASDGIEARRVLDEEGVDVILLDIKMPRKDGWELLAELKEDPELRRIPVVVVSARGEPDEQLRGIASGALAFVPKPYSAESLVRTIERAITGRRPP